MFAQGEYESLSHVYTEDQHDIHDLTIGLRDFIDQYSLKHDLKLYVRRKTLTFGLCALNYISAMLETYEYMYFCLH